VCVLAVHDTMNCVRGYQSFRESHCLHFLFRSHTTSDPWKTV